MYTININETSGSYIKNVVEPKGADREFIKSIFSELNKPNKREVELKISNSNKILTKGMLNAIESYKEFIEEDHEFKDVLKIGFTVNMEDRDIIYPLFDRAIEQKHNFVINIDKLTYEKTLIDYEPNMHGVVLNFNKSVIRL